jgi:hypothetical protein
MEWLGSENPQGNTYNLPGDWLKIEYFEALNILFRIENCLRIFVYIILKNEFKEKWRELSITSDDDEASIIAAIAKKRLAQDMNYAYLGYVLSSPLVHLTSGELIRIITSESYWKFFKAYFPGSKDIMKNKLDEIGNVRNSLAHFRPIKKGDIELVKQNSIHTLSEIEKTLQDFISCPDLVPTNTDESWYKELITLGTEECKISIKQSEREDWVKLILKFRPPIFELIQRHKGWYFAKTANLKTDRVLTDFPTMAKHAIAVTEAIPSTYTTSPEETSFEKQIRFTFSRTSLSKNYAELKTELKKILLLISNEVTLTKEDNLARGKLVEVVSCSIRKTDQSSFYDVGNAAFLTKFNAESPVEFWGVFNSSYGHFVTNTSSYPWMPVDVSEDKSLPF